MIKVNVKHGYDVSHETPTSIGVFYGKELTMEVSLTSKEASKIIQAMVDKMDYDEGLEFVDKYSKQLPPTQ